MEELNKINEDPDFREYMTYEEDQRKIYNSRMSEAEEKGLEKGMKKGLEKGIKEGIEQGIQQGINQVVKQMIDSGMDKNEISKITKLPIERIETLK